MAHRNVISRTFPCLASVLLGSAAAELPAQAPRFIRGDVNLDGQVTHFDLTLMIDLGLVRGQSPRCLKAADIDDNGFVELSTPKEATLLSGWLFRPNRNSFLPEPFPALGSDPTPDALGCDDTATPNPGVRDPDHGLAWKGPIALVRGTKNVELFLVATTSGPILSFAASFRIHRRVFSNVRVDLEGTILPAAAREQIQRSGFFQWRVTPADPDNFDLLRVGAIYVAEGTGQQPVGPQGLSPRWRVLEFDATQKPIKEARILRVVVDVRPEAPLGSIGPVIFEAPNQDFVVTSGRPHGPTSEFARLQAQSTDRIFIPNEELAPPIIVGAEEFFFRGDANFDGTVNISDANALLGFLFLGTAPLSCEDAADANDDGQLNISDASFALGYLFLGTAQPPYPGPRDCGPDFFTEDPIGCEADCRE